MSAMRHPRVLIVLLALLALAAFPSSADANHSWGGYHWARTSNPFTIKLGDNVSGSWDSNARHRLVRLEPIHRARHHRRRRRNETEELPSHQRACRGLQRQLRQHRLARCGADLDHRRRRTSPRVRSRITTTTSATRPTQYNNTAEMQHVICQEIGHTFGLDHQSTDRDRR